MRSRVVMTLIGLTCIVIGTSVGVGGSSIGASVTPFEATKAMGACGAYGQGTRSYCYGGCMGGGCGCVSGLPPIGDGGWTINPAIPCATSMQCTAQITVDGSTPCAGG